MSAIDLHARASADFDAKLAASSGLLAQAARDYASQSANGVSRISQASSLGTEDMVISIPTPRAGQAFLKKRGLRPVTE
jgi:phosphoadenosine phosphosulfate reductase